MLDCRKQEDGNNKTFIEGIMVVTLTFPPIQVVAALVVLCVFSTVHSECFGALSLISSYEVLGKQLLHKMDVLQLVKYLDHKVLL